MREILEHPAITCALRTGYPPDAWEMPEEIYLCSQCGAEITEEQSAYHLCEECEAAALLKFKAILKFAFTKEELEYLDACTEGTSLTEPQNIKPVKAVYP